MSQEGTMAILLIETVVLMIQATKQGDLLGRGQSTCY
jgi:hypothetical protein